MKSQILVAIVSASVIYIGALIVWDHGEIPNLYRIFHISHQ